MLTDKQEYFFNIIENYYKETNTLPNINILKKISNYKSYNTIYKYLKKLEENNYLKYDCLKKQITYLKCSYNDNNIFKIPFINCNKYLTIENNKFNNSFKYYAFKVNNNLLKKEGIRKNDMVIIENNKNYLNNKFVLTNYNQEYNVYKYQKKDGFIHLINDKDIITITNNHDIIGKIVLLIRELF